MRMIRTAIAGILTLLAAATATAQQFPTVPGRSVIGRMGVPGDTGPSQAIPFSTLGPQLQGVQSANKVSAGPASGSAALPAFRSLVPADLPLGVPTNTRSAYTATASLATTDCHKTVALGGSAFYTFTVGAASGYDAACSTIIVNEDSICPSGGASTCRGKTIAINGYSSFILWPGQKFTLVNQNNVWQFNQPGRWVLQNLMTWNVNHALGSNTSDCLGTGAGACATIQNCIYIVEHQIDMNGFGPTCKNVAETFTENNVVHTHPLVGFHVISITGDTTTPSNVVWQVSGTGNVGTQCRDSGDSIITGFKFVSTGTGNYFINGGQLAVCDFGSIEFGANPSGYDLYQSAGGAVNWFGGSISITGDMAGFVLMTGEGHVLIDGATISIPSARTWTNFFQLTGAATLGATSMTFTGTGAGTGSTGRQWLIDHFSNLNVTGSAIPGASVGIYNCTPIASVFTTGTNAAFAPSTCNGVLPIALELELQGGGGGGAGSGTTPGAATAAGATCWNTSGTACTSPVYAAGGGGAGSASPGTNAAGGTVSGSCDDSIAGASAGSGSNQVNTSGTYGGSSPYGGAGAGTFSAIAGGAAAVNSGSGGGGAGASGVANSGGGGAAGAWCRKLITNPLSAYVYTIGAAGVAGTLGTSGAAGGAGAAGRLKVIQRWQ